MFDILWNLCLSNWNKIHFPPLQWSSWGVRATYTIGPTIFVVVQNRSVFTAKWFKLHNCKECKFLWISHHILHFIMLLRSNCSLPSHQSYWPLSWTPVSTVLSTLNDHVLAALVNNCLTFVYLVRSLHCYVLIGVDDSLIHLILWNECLCQNYGVLNLYCKNVSLFPYICLPLSIIPTGVLHFQKYVSSVKYLIQSLQMNLIC